MLNNVSIIPVQSHSIGNQNAAAYGNVFQAHRGMVFEQSPVTTCRKCGGFTLKEEGSSDSINAMVWEDMIYFLSMHNDRLANKIDCYIW